MTEETAGGQIPKSYDVFTPTGLVYDSTNAWSRSILEVDMGDFDLLEEVPTYKDYIKKRAVQYEESNPGFFEAVLAKSDPLAIAAFDEIARKYNEDLPRTREAKDTDRVLKLKRDMEALAQKLPEEDTTPSPTET
ncbi:MAG: hypothetical protein Q7S79_02450 [bacterium]|nr:hypothetical protein [bacterium]